VEYDRPSLNPFCFSEKIFCFLQVTVISRPGGMYLTYSLEPEGTNDLTGHDLTGLSHVGYYGLRYATAGLLGLPMADLEGVLRVL